MSDTQQQLKELAATLSELVLRLKNMDERLQQLESEYRWSSNAVCKVTDRVDLLRADVDAIFASYKRRA